MHFPSDAMPGIFPDGSESVPLRMDLDGVPHISQPVSGHALPDAFPEAFLGYPDQLLCFLADLADTRGKRGVCLPAVLHQRAVNADYVAVLQDPPFTGDPVHHLVIDAGADGARITLIVQGGRNRTVLPDQLFRQDVQLGRGYAGADMFPHLVFHFPQDLSGFPHFGNLPRVFQTDHA